MVAEACIGIIGNGMVMVVAKLMQFLLSPGAV